MKDTLLRGIVLAKYYERRREQFFTPKPEDFEVLISQEDILAISCQLSEHNLIEWKVLKSFGNVQAGLGKIRAFGIDVVEGEATSDIKVEFVQNKTVNITGSSNVIVGNNNQQHVAFHITELRRAIDASEAATEEKIGAKKLLSDFAQHPLVAAIVGGAVGLLGN